MSFVEIDDIQHLRIGVFVKLEDSWFSHPFHTNIFTLMSADQEEQTRKEESRIPESALSELHDRREDYHEFIDHLRKVEGAYQKTLAQGQELFQQLSSRRPDCHQDRQCHAYEYDAGLA